MAGYQPDAAGEDENGIPEEEKKQSVKASLEPDLNASISRQGHYNIFHMFKNAEKAWELREGLGNEKGTRYKKNGV